MENQKPADSVSPDVGFAMDSQPRFVLIGQQLRYARGAGQVDRVIDGFPNYHWMLSPADLGLPCLMLEAGINAPAGLAAVDGPRRPVIAIRSSPWKAGHETNPWHDEFDLDRGLVKYFGDHKPSTDGAVGSTKGNGLLIKASQLHAGRTRTERLSAPPLLVFRAVTVKKNGRSVTKGHIEFCGVAVIERMRDVLQSDPESGQTFPNITLDLAIMSGDQVDGVDLRWIDDRRDETLSADQALRHAPASWVRWVNQGATALTGMRRLGERRIKSDVIVAANPTATDNLVAIRQWAVDNGHDVAPRGRISRDVIDAYSQATK